MAIGRPISLTPNIATKAISVVATASQKDFTVTGGYRINELSVYKNGVRLAQGRDFTANDGSTVTLDTAASAGNIIEFVVFDTFNVANSLVSAASSQTLNGDFNITGKLYAAEFQNADSLNIGVGTFASFLHVGSALTANAAGDVETVGVITAASFSGSFTGAATEITVADESSDTTCFPTFVTDVQGNVSPKTGTNLTFNSSSGALTATSVAGNIVGGTGSFSGAVNVDDTTDSTSATSGSLIVDGGLGVAKNVYIGAGLSVAGTLTYEDVTNVDSVGLITAKSGVNITGGELKVGTAVTIGSAGIITSMGGTLDLKNSGSVSNIKLYCESGNSHYTQIQSAAHGSYSGNVTLTLPVTTDTLIGRTTTDTLTNKTLTSPTINTLSGDTASFSSNLTVGSGITFGSAGVATFSGTADVHLRDSVRLNAGDSSDLTIYHDGSHSVIQHANVGNLYINANSGQINFEGNSETLAQFIPNGACKLYYDSSEKIVTTKHGTVTTGIATATSFSGGTYTSTDWFVNDTAAEGIKNSATGQFFFSQASNETRLYHGSNAQVKLSFRGTGDTYRGAINADANGMALLTGASSEEYGILCVADGATNLYCDASKKFETTKDGTVTTGISTFSQGCDFNGLLREKHNQVDAKLSAGVNIDLEDGMLHYYSVNETTTATPNIRYNSSKSLNNMMTIGETVTVTIIYKPNGAGYYAALNVDGSGVTEEWNGGSAPSSANAGGYDILTHTLFKVADASFLCFSNVQNYA